MDIYSQFEESQLFTERFTQWPRSILTQQGKRVL